MSSTNRKAAVAATETMPARLVATHGGSLEMTVTLNYRSWDPYAVSATMETPSLSVTWTFARELLERGLREPTGDGDVHTRPCLDTRGGVVLVLELSSDGSDALVELPTETVSAFVDRTLAAVPAGTESEHLDIDDVLEAIFADAA
jgi:hypothetical protein